LFAHAIQLVVLRPPQTVLLDVGLRGKEEKTRLCRKFSQASHFDAGWHQISITPGATRGCGATAPHYGAMLRIRDLLIFSGAELGL